ncbi:hypothetical protein PILCRDRAFT_826847, partial [Piloderma croceum F 1598]
MTKIVASRSWMVWFSVQLRSSIVRNSCITSSKLPELRSGQPKNQQAVLLWYTAKRSSYHVPSCVCMCTAARYWRDNSLTDFSSLCIHGTAPGSTRIMQSDHCQKHIRVLSRPTCSCSEFGCV